MIVSGHLIAMAAAVLVFGDAWSCCGGRRAVVWVVAVLGFLLFYLLVVVVVCRVCATEWCVIGLQRRHCVRGACACTSMWVSLRGFFVTVPPSVCIRQRHSHGTVVTQGPRRIISTPTPLAPLLQSCSWPSSRFVGPPRRVVALCSCRVHWVATKVRGPQRRDDSAAGDVDRHRLMLLIRMRQTPRACHPRK